MMGFIFLVGYPNDIDLPDYKDIDTSNMPEWSARVIKTKQEEKIMDLNEKQLHTLRHMLGINTPDDRTPKPNRNYAAVNPGDTEFVKLEQLGVIIKYFIHKPGFSQYDWYECTKKGRRIAMRSHRDIRKTKAQRRYTAYLDMTDVYPGLTFKDFLTHPDFSTARREA